MFLELSQNMTFTSTEQRIFHRYDQTVCVFKASLLLTADSGADTLSPMLNNWTSFLCVVLAVSSGPALCASCYA